MDMEEQADYVTEAMELLNGEPAAIIEQPRARLILRNGLDEQWTVAWVKMSTAFKPHIKELHGAPLAVWLFICLSINKQGMAFPGIRTIAEETGYSHQGVLNAIEKLEKKGYLIVKRGERRFNVYRPEFAAIGQTNEPSGTVNLVDSSFSLERSTFSPEESSPVDLNKKNKREQDKTGFPENTSIEWYIVHNLPIPEHLIDNTQQDKAALDTFEQVFGYGSLPWDSTSVWTKFHKFIVKVYVENPNAFTEYIAWRASGGKYDAMSPRKIRENPQMFMDTGWPNFLAHSAMYQKPAPSKPLNLEVPDAIPNPGKKPDLSKYTANGV